MMSSNNTNTMKEYGNYLPREDAAVSPSNHYRGKVVDRAKLMSSPFEKHSVAKSIIQPLVSEAKERGEMRMAIEKIFSNQYIFYPYF